MLPELTIIICTRNGAARLPAALKSLNKLELSNAAVEIVIVDNGSSDDTALVVRQAQRQSPQCIHYIFEPRPGLSVARNHGIAFASGKLVAFIDDDAEVTRFWFTGIRQAFDSPCKPTAVVGPILPRTPLIFPDWFPQRLISHLSIMNRGSQARLLHYPNYGFGANMAFRREVFDELKGFDTSLGRSPQAPFRTGEETDFFLRIERNGGRIFYTPKAIVRHTVPPERLNPTWLMRQTYWIGRASGQIEKKSLPGYHIALIALMAAIQLFLGLLMMPLTFLLSNQRLSIFVRCGVLNRLGYLNTFWRKPSTG